MDDYYSDNQPELIHCDNCGEDYAATYRSCPFCHTAPNGKKVGGRAGRSSREGNRVRTNTRGGGYGGARSPLSIVGIVLSIILLVAAIVIVAVLVKSALSNRAASNPDAGQNAVTSLEDGQQPDSSESENTVIPPDGLTLDQTEITLNSGEFATLSAAVVPEGWIGQVIWASSDGAVATVDQSGVVTYVAAGDCTITASAAGVTASCTVHCAGAETPDEPAQPSDVPSSIVVTAFGNTMDGDFTLKVGDVIPFRATGGDGANYEWSIADTSIASVDGSGSCTALTAGITSMTVTSGGESTTVTIRVK